MRMNETLLELETQGQELQSEEALLYTQKVQSEFSIRPGGTILRSWTEEKQRYLWPGGGGGASWASHF